MADKVKNLHTKKEAEIRNVNHLSGLLENPEKHPRRRDLEGEDPDQDALTAKI